MNGILVVNKPSGYTSRDIVNIVGKHLGTKKIGHTGTLDPLASGVLVLLVGRYTKLGEIFTFKDKEYIAQVKLGVATDTLDITGRVLKEDNYFIKEDDIIKTFKSFIGTYHMEVPIYSAIKVNGKKLYEYARNNEKVCLPVKDVQIYELELLDFTDDIISFKAKVEKGTYIRSLIRDLCKSLGTIGTMSSLTRIKQGDFSLEESYTLKDIKENKFKMMNVKEALNLEEYSLNEKEYSKVINGNPLIINNKVEYILFTYHHEEIAIYQKKDEAYKPLVMIKINN